jgi:hypothetical protein
MRQIEAGYFQVREMEKIYRECRTLAFKHSFVIKWSIKERTATAYLKFNGSVIWKADFTHEMPHMVTLLMYLGVHAELTHREKLNQESIIRMRIAEEEREKERRIANMPGWGEGRQR